MITRTGVLAVAAAVAALAAVSAPPAALGSPGASLLAREPVAVAGRALRPGADDGGVPARAHRAPDRLDPGAPVYRHRPLASGRIAIDAKGDVWSSNNWLPGTKDGGPYVTVLNPVGRPTLSTAISSQLLS